VTVETTTSRKERTMRNAASKVLWAGRAASAVVGLAVMLALVLGVASAAFAGNLDPLKLGTAKNVATKATALVGKAATGSAFVVNNPSGGSALGLQVSAGQAPLTVNAEAGTATNLSADELDGKSAEDFYAQGSKVADSSHADQATNATKLDDKQAADFIQRDPAAAQNGSIHIDGTLQTSGMVRTGSGTGTFEGPGAGHLSTYEGLVIRRAASNSTSPGNVVARSEYLRLERDGSPGGLRVAWNATAGGSIACMRLTQAGAPVGNYSEVGGSTAGTFQVFTNSQNVVYYSCSFGRLNGYMGHVTEVSMARTEGTKSWVGTLTSSVNQ
jgi:hypothetical protein